MFKGPSRSVYVGDRKGALAFAKAGTCVAPSDGDGVGRVVSAEVEDLGD